MSARICVLGSLNMDLVVRPQRLPAPGETLLADSFQTFPGGKGANQAVAAARLGAQVAMIGRVGDDAFGRALRRELERHGVDTAQVRSIEGVPSGVALITVEANGENTIVVVPGANQHLDPGEIDAAGGMLVSIGDASSVIAQLEVPVVLVDQAARAANAAGATFVLNAAPALPLSDSLLRRVDVLIVNRSEAAVLVGSPVTASVEELADELLRRGPKLVVVTLGAQGAFARAGSDLVYQDVFSVPAVDAVAAGDAFVGALVVALDERRPLAEALRFACAAGALATTREGAQPSLPDRAAVEALAAG